MGSRGNSVGTHWELTENSVGIQWERGGSGIGICIFVKLTNNKQNIRPDGRCDAKDIINHVKLTSL